jgi:WD40 repeat protein
MKSILLFTIAAFLIMCAPGKTDTTKVQNAKTTTIDNKEPANKVTSAYYCDYLGETPPGNIPVIFGKDIISTSKDEICFEINYKGDVMIIDRAGTVILLENTGSSWSEPATAPFSGKVVDGECCFAPGEDKIYFASRRSLPGAKGELNTWVSEKKDGKWSTLYPIKKPLWDANTHAISVANSGNIYQSGVTYFKYNNGEYLPQETLSNNTNGTHPFIAPDETYVIFCARSEGRWDKDLFISFNKNNFWSKPIALNNKINTVGKESNPFVTPDGQYLFFQRQNDIFWVDFGFVDTLRNSAVY